MLMLWFMVGIFVFVSLLFGTVMILIAFGNAEGIVNYIGSSKFQLRFLKLFAKVLFFSFAGTFYFMHWKIKHAGTMFNAAPLVMKSTHPFYRALENLCIARGLKTPDLYLANDHPELVTSAVLQGFSKTSKLILSRAVLDLPSAQQEALAAQAVQRLYTRDAVFFTFFCFLGYFPYHMLDAVGKFRKALLSPFLKIVEWILKPVRPLIFNMRLARVDAGSLELTKDKESMLQLLARLPSREQLAVYYYDPYLALFITGSGENYRKQSLNKAL